MRKAKEKTKEVKNTSNILNFDNLKEPRIKSEVKSINLGYIIDEMDKKLLDFNPPYQRAVVWKGSLNADLMMSIFDGTPIGAIHFVRKKNGIKKWVLDGKQRLSCVKSFRDGKFKIKINFKNKIISVGWEDISDPENELYFLYQRICEFPVSVVTWDNCSFEEQKEIFERVNNSLPLNSWEVIYGQHFIVKQLLKYMFDNCFIDKSFLKKQCSGDYRNGGIKLLHSLMVLSFGDRFEDVFAVRNLSSKTIENSCKKLEQKLRNVNLDANTEFDELMIRECGLEDQVNTVKMASRWFEKACNYKNPLTKGKTFEGIFILDVIAFMINKYQIGQLTNSYVEQNLEKIYEFIKRWNDYKNKDQQTTQAIKSRTTNTRSIEVKVKEMERIFGELSFDTTTKGKKITAGQKLSAVLEASPVCPISGIYLTDKNTQFDHVTPSSVSGETKVHVLSDFANRRKSDQALDTVEATVKYMKNNL